MNKAPDVTVRVRHIVPIGGRPIAGEWLRILRGRVVSLGSGPAPGPCVELDDCLVVPGFVNAHTHLEFSDLDAPLTGQAGLPAWIARIVALRRSRPAGVGCETAPSSIRAGLLESAAAGVTTIGEIATTLPAHDTFTTGPRVRVFREALGLSAPVTEAALATLRRDVGHLIAAGIPAGISPHAPYSVTAPLGRRLLEIARRARLPAAMHLAESPAEAELVAAGSGEFRALLESLGAWPAATPPRLLSAADWISLLARGPRGLVVHGTFLDDDALGRLARHRDRLAVVVCPRTTRLLSGALPPLARLRAAGVRIALGTDSRASNPDLSVRGECRALVDGGLASPAEALRMATVDGAWALGFERHTGTLAPGRPADLVILRPTRPCNDPHEAALEPDTAVVATLRGGQLLHGRLER